MDWSSLFSGLTTLGTSITKAVIGPQIATIPAGTQIVGASGNTLIAEQTPGALLGTGLSSLFGNPMILILIIGLIAFLVIEK